MPTVRTHHHGSTTRQNILRRAVTAAVVIGLSAATTPSADAADVHWNVADGNWAEPLNWNPAAVPTAADAAILDFAGGGTAHVNTDLADDVLYLTIKNGNTLSIEAGGDLRTVAGNAAVIINDPLQAIRIGDGSVGSATVTDGTLINTFTNPTSNQSSDIYVGVLTGGVGTFTQSGSASVVKSRDFRIGSDVATGTASLNGGTTTVNWMIVGRTGGTGTLNVDGGTVNATVTGGGRLQVADGANSTGTVNLASGIINTTGEVNIGAGGGGHGTGTMTHTGGTLTTTHSLTVGRNGTSAGANRGFGTYTLGTDASSTATIDVNFTPAVPPALPTNGSMVVGLNGGKGNMVMNGGTISTDAGLYIGHNTGGNVANRSEGTFDLNAGTITVGDIFVVGMDAASGTMTMDGGTINVTGGGFVGNDDRSLATRTTLAQGTLDQHAGTINAAAFTVATQKSTGTYNLDGTAALNVGTGTTGDMLIGGPDAVSTGKMTIGGTAAVTVAGGLRMGQSAGKGTLTMTGGTLAVTGNSLVGQSGASVATLDLSGGAATFGGNLTVGDAGTSNGTLALSGNGTLNVTGTLVVGRNTTIGATVNQSGATVTAGSLGIRTGTGTVGDYNLAVGTVTAGVVTNNGTFDASGTGVANLGPVGGTGGITVADTAVVNAAHVRQASLAMTGGLVKIAETTTGTRAGVSVVPAYTIGAGAKFDLTDNKLVTDKPAGTASGGVYAEGSVQRDVQRAYAGRTWAGDGLTTSKAQAKSGLTTLAVLTGKQYNNTTFAGQPITETSTIVMYTYGGDTNLDGRLNADDYGSIDFAILKPGADGYYNGDFNYDGKVNADDYGVIDFNILAQQGQFDTGAAVVLDGGGAAGLSGVTAVPEPASLSVVAVAAAGLLARRRRREPQR